MSYEVKLDAFEGPLDLLLHLINRLEIDIYDIPMAKLTAQYMEHIHAMQQLELNEASEYLVMAATLLAIKSKTLLPIHEGEQFDEDFEIDIQDPRDELVERLLEYRKYKEAAEQLQKMEETQAVQYTKPPTDLSHLQPISQLELFDEEANVYDLIAAFQKMIRRKQLKAPLHTKIAKQEISLKSRMKTLCNELYEKGGSCEFQELFQDAPKETIVVSFLSILELMKRQIVHVQQQHNFQELYIQLQVENWKEGSFDDVDESN